MKTFRNHKCASKHRTGNKFARCALPYTAVSGDGLYGSLAKCGRKWTLYLFETQEQAEAAKKGIDAYACGGGCIRAAGHEVIRIDLG